jgi:hypothetical protein
MVIRVNKTTDYTVMSNTHLRDRNLSLKAKGLLSLMLSLPDNWDYSLAGIVSIVKEGSGAVQSAFAELKKAGYLIITKKMPCETESGRIEYEYNIYEKPKTRPQKQPPCFQGLEIQGLENSIQINTNILNTNKQNTEISLSKEDGAKKIWADVMYRYCNLSLYDINKTDFYSLCTILSRDDIMHYVEVIINCADDGKPFSNPYMAIIKMAKKDKKIE